jgi:selenide,water dikinase
MQSTSHPGVFGAGDCATQVADPRPKAGVFAVRAGPLLARNLRAWLGGQPLAPFRTPRRYLALVSTGRKHAVGSWGPFGWEGDWAWSWKDRIDRRFVDRFTAT